MQTVDGVQAVDRALTEDLRTLVELHAASLPVHRVTVIGNAPLEPNPRRVEVIESSDLVVRVNSFVLDEPGDPPRMGRRTDVVVAARDTRITPWFFHDYPSRPYLIVDAGNVRKPEPRTTPASWPDDLASWPISNRIFGWPLKRRIRPETNGVGAVPTTGTEAAYVMRMLFPEAQLVLVGYSFLEDREQTSWKHQWGDECIVHPTHKLDREGALLQSWVDDGSATTLS